MVPPDKSFPDFKQKAHWDCTGDLVLILRSDQGTCTCFHHKTPFYAFLSHILTFVRFPSFFYDWRVASLVMGKSWNVGGGGETRNFVITHVVLLVILPLNFTRFIPLSPTIEH